MFRGFYNLTSGMLTQQRNLDVVGNNLTNVSTSGFKQSRYTATTFDEVMLSWAGTKDKSYQEIGGPYAYIRATSQIYTDYSQGLPEPTNITLDFAIEGAGFFAIRGDDGQTYYTRSGTFTLDNEGYLCYPGKGRIIGADGQDIRLNTDRIDADKSGNMYNYDGNLLGTLGIYTFADDEAQLQHEGEGFFTGQGAQLDENPLVHWQYLERANVDMIQQMTELLTCQRSLQSAAQVSKMYDNMMTKTTNDVGRL